MSPHENPIVVPSVPTYLSISRKVVLGLLALAVIGGMGSIAGATLYTHGSRRIMLAYLVAVSFVLSLSLGSLFIVLIQHLTRAGWGVLVRRPAEVFALNIITVAVLTLPIAWSALSGVNSIYPWARGMHSSTAETGHAQIQAGLQPVKNDTPNDQTTNAVLQLAASHSTHSTPPAESAEHGSQSNQHGALSHMYIHQNYDELTASKSSWLNPSFFVTRLTIYFCVWGMIAAFYFERSRNQDLSHDPANTRQMEWWSGLATFLFAITLTFAAFDLLMSLDPHWYSTIFGVYFFAGCAVGGFGICLLSWLLLTRWQVVAIRLSDDHLRDLGRLMFAFIFFWGYIAFSQYMLLWYANIPETTRWWVVRGASMAEGYRNSWGILLIVLLCGHFVIPFLGIMSRHVKRNRNAMIFWTIWMLAMHYLDLLWLVMPELGPRLVFGLPELGTLLLVASVYFLGASFLSTFIGLVPVGDPRFSSSIALSDAY